MPSTEGYTAAEAAQMLSLARQAIRDGLQGVASDYLPGVVEPALRVERACFVTLRQAGELRGCIGNLSAEDSLAKGIVRNARLAAFEDPRFPPLAEQEFTRTVIEIAVLTEPVPVSVADEADLSARLRPTVDGLVIRFQDKQATFLPAVWEQIPDPVRFVQQLKRKAGLAEEFWDERVLCSVYQAIKVSE